jgi:hypothetical protein
MSVSLESRVPLLDHRIADLMTRMPPTARFKGGDTKRVFREAVRNVLPPVVLERKDKMGFPVPLAEWFGGPVRNFIGDILLSDRARQRGIYRMAGVERLVAGEAKFGRQLWGLLSLELWFRAVVDGEQTPTPRSATASPSKAFRPGCAVSNSRRPRSSRCATACSRCLPAARETASRTPSPRSSSPRSRERTVWHRG